MSAGVSVAATGSAWAFLLFENGNSRNNQAGFLLGDVVSEKKNLISDSEYEREKTETVIHVHAIVHDQSLSSSYTLWDNKYSERDTCEKIKNSVVGWYSFRRNVTAVPTLKDRFIHKQLLEKFKGNKECFLFCLLTSSENNESKSHSFRQHFLLYNPSIGKFEAIPLLIENLANISPQYRTPLPPTGEKLLQKCIDPAWDSQNLVDRLQEKLASKLQGAISDLLDSERKITETEHVLSNMRKNHDEMKQAYEKCYLNSPKRDEESNVTRENKRKVDERGDRGDTNLNSTEPSYISDECPMSPVFGSSLNKRPPRNVSKQ